MKKLQLKTKERFGIPEFVSIAGKKYKIKFDWTKDIGGSWGTYEQEIILSCKSASPDRVWSWLIHEILELCLVECNCTWRNEGGTGSLFNMNHSEFENAGNMFFIAIKPLLKGDLNERR